MEYLKNLLEYFKFFFCGDPDAGRYWKLKKERDKAYEQEHFFKVMQLEKEMEIQEELDNIKRIVLENLGFRIKERGG